MDLICNDPTSFHPPTRHLMFFHVLPKIGNGQNSIDLESEIERFFAEYRDAAKQAGNPEVEVQEWWGDRYVGPGYREGEQMLIDWLKDHGYKSRNNGYNSYTWER